MNRLVPVGLSLLALATLLLPASAADPAPLSPSPDGHFVILQSDTAGQPPAVIADKDTGKTVRAIIQPSNEVHETLGTVLWKPESDRLALVTSTTPFDHVLAVYVHQGDTFDRIEIPTLPLATIPAKYGPDTKLKHWSALATPNPTRWLKDGSLVVEITSTADDSHIAVTATRTIVIAFPINQKPRITTSTLKITSAHLE